MGGQDVVDLDNWIQALKSAYSQVLVRGGTATNKARERADEVINEAYSKNQLAAIVRDLQNEGAGAKKAAGTAENEAISKGSGGDEPAAPGDDTDTIKQSLEAHGQTYDPDKFDYRIGPNGQVQAKPKSAGGEGASPPP